MDDYEIVEEEDLNMIEVESVLLADPVRKFRKLFEDLTLDEVELLATESKLLENAVKGLEDLIKQMKETGDQSVLSLLLKKVEDEIALYKIFLNGTSLETLTMECELTSVPDEIEPDTPTMPATELKVEISSTVESEVGSDILKVTKSSIAEETAQPNLPYRHSIGASSFGSIFGLNSRASSYQNNFFKWNSLPFLADSRFISDNGDITSLIIAHITAIGTANGSIFLYEGSRLSKLSSLPEYGSVSSLSLSPDQLLLIAGYSLGHVVLFDVKKSIVIDTLEPTVDDRELHDHLYGVAIRSVQAYSKDIFFSADEKGRAFFHEIRKGLFKNTIDSTKIHGGLDIGDRKVTIHSFKCAPDPKVKYPGDANILIALTTPSKIAVLAMKPKPQILFRLNWSQLTQNEDFLSTVDQSHLAWHTTTSAAYLSYSFGKSLGIIKLEWIVEGIYSSRKLKFRVIEKLDFDHVIHELEWINEKFLVCKTDDSLFLFMTGPLKSLESCKISETPLGESVDARLLSPFKGKLFVLDETRIWVLSLYTWQERLEALVKSGEYETALCNLTLIYRGEFPIAVLGINDEDEIRQSLVSSFTKQQILYILTSSITNGNNISNYRYFCKLLMNVCNNQNLLDFVFTTVYAHFKIQRLEYEYFAELSNLVLTEQIKSIPNELLLEMLQMPIESVEQVVLHLDPATFDKDLVLDVCRTRGYPSALIYVYNQGFNEYRKPLLELLFKVGHEVPDDATDDLYLLYVYVSYTMSGKAFPVGDIDLQNAPRNARDVAHCVFSAKYLQFHYLPSLEHSTLRVGKEPWPIFSFLLSRDTRQMLIVLSSIFESDLWVSVPEEPETPLISKKLVIDILEVFLQDSIWTETQRDLIMAFVVRMNELYSSEALLTEKQLGLFFSKLLLSDNVESIKERENSLLAVYKNGNLPISVRNDLKSFQTALERAKLWKIYELVVLNDAKFELALNSYLSDQSRVEFIFDAIETWIQASKVEPQLILEALKREAAKLMFKGSKLAKVVSTYWPNEHLNFLANLNSDVKMQYEYLDAIVNSENLERNYLITSDILQTLVQSYIVLQTRMYPSKVKPYLQKCGDSNSSLPFDPAKLLNYCTTDELLDAKVWLLVRSDQFTGAVSASIQLLWIKIGHLESIDHLIKYKQQQHEIEQLVKDTIDLCNSQINNDQLWNLLLEEFYFKILPTNPFLVKIRKETIPFVLKQIDVIEIITRLLNSTNNSHLGLYREFIMELIAEYRFRLSNGNFSLKLSQMDSFDQTLKYLRIKNSSLWPVLGQCYLCQKLLHLKAMSVEEQNDKLIIFGCGHAYHCRCLEASIGQLSNPRCVACGSQTSLYISESVRRDKGKEKLYDDVPVKDQVAKNQFTIIETLAYRSPNLIDLYRSLNVVSTDLAKDEIQLHEDD